MYNIFMHCKFVLPLPLSTILCNLIEAYIMFFFVFFLFHDLVVLFFGGRRFVLEDNNNELCIKSLLYMSHSVI